MWSRKMKLTKKHIGKLFDVDGSDGSWCYLLVDVKGKELLCYGMNGTYAICTNKYADWRPFKPQKFKRLFWILGKSLTE